jgi:hypothetical protein
MMIFHSYVSLPEGNSRSLQPLNHFLGIFVGDLSPAAPLRPETSGTVDTVQRTASITCPVAMVMAIQ